MLAVKNRHVADDSGEFTSCPIGELCGEFLLLAFKFIEANLDQFVRLKRVLCRSHESIGEALPSDQHNRIQRMGETAKSFSLGTC